ncbi:MAG: CPBP family intramembrane metalloprotease [Kiritimatiellae bacterium]|nr:CPBP family intramembrane metalloprotease [Kiritimatiellia bacterium]
MAPPPSRYGPLHALAAGAVLVFAVLSNGFAAFWRQFLHGLDIEITDANILPLLCTNTLLFGGLFLILWISTFFGKRYSHEGDEHPRKGRTSSWPRCVRLTLLSAIPIALVALGLNWASGELLSRLAGINLSDQDLVKVVTSNTLSPGNKTILYSFLLLEAPLLEEPLFRGVIFGGLAKIMPAGLAMALSGLLFALIHVNAATLIPLWFLGVAFAWLYARTGTLLAPMAVHFAFNAANLALCLVF